MNHPSSRKPITGLFAALLLAGAAQAATYTTLFTGTSDATLFDLDHIEVTWSTTETFGNAINETHLSDLTISLYDSGNTLFYSATVIAGGVVQSIGGVSRSISDVSFTATTGVSINNSFDNDLNQLQLSSASGTTFNIYGNAGSLFNVAFYEDGVAQEDANFNITGQSTSAIPEPSAFAATAGLLGLGTVLTGRRRRA